MIHQATEVRRVSHLVGDGVFATAPIAKGTIVWTQDALDAVFDAEACSRLGEASLRLLDHYAHIDEYGRFVLCWDAGKLINHSCTPTLRGVGTWFQVARRDIAPGEELTCDYAECNIQAPLECRCQISSCRGSVHADDLLRHADDWDHEAEELRQLLGQVEQPLWPYLLDPEQAAAYADARLPLPSFRALHSRGFERERT